MSYLPLCFAGIQILDVWVAISVAGTVYFPSLESGQWSGLPRISGTVSAGSKRDSGPMWIAEPGVGVGDKVGMITLFPAVGREVQGPIEKGKSRGATSPSTCRPLSGLSGLSPTWGKVSSWHVLCLSPELFSVLG